MPARLGLSPCPSTTRRCRAHPVAALSSPIRPPSASWFRIPAALRGRRSARYALGADLADSTGGSRYGRGSPQWWGTAGCLRTCCRPAPPAPHCYAGEGSPRCRHGVTEIDDNGVANDPASGAILLSLSEPPTYLHKGRQQGVASAASSPGRSILLPPASSAPPALSPPSPDQGRPSRTPTTQPTHAVRLKQGQRRRSSRSTSPGCTGIIRFRMSM